MLHKNMPEKIGHFRLRRVDTNTFQLHVQYGPSFEGTRVAIFLKAVEFGIEPAEFDLAVAEMERKNHQYAEFGIFGRFLFSAVDPKWRVA